MLTLARGVPIYEWAMPTEKTSVILGGPSDQGASNRDDRPRGRDA